MASSDSGSGGDRPGRDGAAEPRRARALTASELHDVEEAGPHWLRGIPLDEPVEGDFPTQSYRRDRAEELSRTGPLPDEPKPRPSQPPPRPSTRPGRSLPSLPDHPGITMKGPAPVWGQGVRPPNPALALNEQRAPVEPTQPPSSAGEAKANRGKAPLERPLELLWSDDARSEEMAAHPDWLGLYEAAPPPPRREVPGSGDSLLDVTPEPEDEPPPPRRVVTAVLRKATPTPLGQLERLLAEHLTTSDELSPPLVMVAARLQLQFDVRQELEELIATVKPLAKHNRKLEEARAHAEDMLETPIEAAPAMARAVAEQLRKTWREANRALPNEYLDETVQRVLLTKRAYETRELLDARWLRALAHDKKREVVVYLPDTVAKRLPLFRELSCRLVAEVLPTQDSQEVDSVCLRVVALARELGSKR